MASAPADVGIVSEQWHAMAVIEFSSHQTLLAILNMNCESVCYEPHKVCVIGTNLDGRVPSSVDVFGIGP